LAPNWKSAPPEKSMPRVKPRTTMLMTQMASSVPDRMYQTLRRPTKS
jgi:hypothetical protein